MKQKKTWIWLLALSLGILVFWYAGAQGFARELIYPYENCKVWLDRSVGVRVKALFSRVRYAARNAMLERDLARLRMLAAENTQLMAEVAHLRSLLDFAPAQPTHWQVAPVLSRGGTTALWQHLRVGKGSLHGVRKGDPVVVPDGVVGRVSVVSLHTSEVMLISDPNSRVACQLETPGDDLGVVRGILYGGGARPGAEPYMTLLYVVDPLRLRHLRRDFIPPPQARVVTSGLGAIFPAGLPVGYLLDSAPAGDNLTREASIMPAVDLAALEEVFILARGEGRAP